MGDRDADELLVVDDMRTRKGLMDSRSDAFLTLPGGLGTLEELSEVWVARTLGLHDKPVVALDVDGLYAPLRAQVALMTERGFLREEAADALVWTSTVGEALDAVEARPGAGPCGCGPRRRRRWRPSRRPAPDRATWRRRCAERVRGAPAQRRRRSAGGRTSGLAGRPRRRA